MTWFPAITRPCPIADRLDTVLNGNDCGHCGQTVHDLDGTTEAMRRRLMATAPGELCVRYSRPIAKAILATAALGGGTLVHAQPGTPTDMTLASQAATETHASSITSVIVQQVGDNAEDMEIIVGGARRIPRGYEYVESTAAEDRREERDAARAEIREQRRLDARARRSVRLARSTV